MSMQKKLLIIFINIILVLNVVIITDWIFCTGEFYKVIYPMTPVYDNGREENDLPINKNKGSIVTVGDSFTFGDFINQEDTFSYKLQQKTQRKTYNRGYSGGGVQHVLYQLEYSDFFNNLSPEPEYIIYTFIGDHARRIYVNYIAGISNQKNLRYSNKNGKLVLNNLDVTPVDKIKVSMLAKKIEDLSFKLKSNNTKFDFLKMHILECKKIIDKKYKKTKFVVLVYNPNLDLHIQKPFYSNRWGELEKEGIKVIRLDDKKYDYLNTKDYLAEDDIHPSGKAWDEITDIVIKELNL